MARKRTASDAELIENETSSPKRRKLDPNENDQISSLDSVEEKQVNDKSINSDKIISLQVGERKYTTRISTLTKYENCYFTSLFAGNFASDKTYNESIFIDRDGDMFYFVLQYLRSGTLIISSNENNKDTLLILQKLLIEAQFYMIQPLMKYIQSQLPKPPRQCLPGSKILSCDEQKKMRNILDEEEFAHIWEKKVDETSRVYQQMQTYYKEKDDYVATIVLCEDTAGNVFGVKSDLGICLFTDLFPDGHDKYSELMEKQQAIYFNIRDVENKIPPFTVFAEFNELMVGFVRSSIGEREKSKSLGCYISRNSKHLKDQHVTVLEMNNNLKSTGKRVTAVKGDDTVFSKGKFMYSEFVTARIEVFVQTDKWYDDDDDDESDIATT